eukprot:12570543-Heterocapsa_arctica.AAC.1
MAELKSRIQGKGAGNGNVTPTAAPFAGTLPWQSGAAPGPVAAASGVSASRRTSRAPIAELIFERAAQ